MKSMVALFVFLLNIGNGAAQVKERTDDQGVTHFSNEPGSRSERKMPPGREVASDPRCRGIDYDALRGSLIQRSENGGRHVYVTRAWYGLTIDVKKSIAQYLAVCRSEAGWAEILDAQTGRRLGKGSEAWGYSNYEK